MKLNVGAGKDIREGWINLDMHKTFNADVIFNLQDIFKGVKLPFEDNSIDYVYCSHVLEDFINPKPIIDEFVRICKIGGKIELRTPSETNIWSGNLHHIKPFSLRMFKGIANDSKNNYGEGYNLKISKLFYYCADRSGGFFLESYKSFFLWIFNKLGSRIENTPLEYLMRMKDVGVVYTKLK